MALEEVIVISDGDVLIAPEPDDDVILTADFEVETINVPGQGPPGPPGTSGTDGADGNTILYGGSDPIPSQGKDGDSYINTTTHFMFGPKASGLWPPGVSLVGPAGPRGNTVLYGSGPPANSVGLDGDFYVDQTTHTMYGPKAGGVWPSSGTSLVGPQGPPGIQGVPGQRGSLWYEGSGPPGTISGQQDQDNYLNVANGDVYTLVAGSWGSPVGNIRGPQGVPGTPGAITVDAPSDGQMYARKNAAWVSFGTVAVLVADAAPVGAPDNALWWESDTGNLYVRYNDGNSTQWVMVASPLNYGAIPAVRYDAAQVLTAAQQQQARQNIFAAPFDAMAYQGLQINGNFEVAQERGSSALSITTGQFAYILDQFAIGYNCAAISSFTGQQTIVSPGGQPFGMALLGALAMTSGSAGSVGGSSGDNAYMQTIIEGQRISRLGWGSAGAKPVTLSFWFAATRAGTYAVAIRNWNGGSPNRSYVAPFTYSAGGLAWEFKQITVPGDVTGTWARDVSPGWYLSWTLGAGSGVKTPTDHAWVAGGYMGCTTQSSAFSANGDQAYVAGLHIAMGNEGPTSDRIPYLMRSFDDEYARCQRYLQYIVTGLRFNATGGGQVGESIHHFPTSMRSAPTMSFIGTPLVGSSNVQASYPQLQTPSSGAVRFLLASNGAGDCYHLCQTAKCDARMS